MNFPIDNWTNTSTPFYYYDLSILNNTLSTLVKAASKRKYHVHYAMKANSNFEVLEQIKRYGLGVDCVSGNEILRALSCGFDPSSIVFAGVGKTDKEIEIGMLNNIFSFNVESLEELQVIEELARNQDRIANVSLRLNPNVMAETHEYITTGLNENKFGISPVELDEVIELVLNSEYIKFKGLHFHIGSQITNLQAYRDLCDRINEIQDFLYHKGVVAMHINVGGGLGVDYENPNNSIPDFESFFALFESDLELLPNQQLHFELGRSIVAQCGALITRVLYTKKGVERNFAICDAGMTELMRPSLYKAYHHIENLTSTSDDHNTYDVVGPICESSDFLGKQRHLPTTTRGDLLAIRTAGAYGEVMANQYNLREMVRNEHSYAFC